MLATSEGRFHSARIVSRVAERFFLIKNSSTTIQQKLSKIASVEALSEAMSKSRFSLGYKLSRPVQLLKASVHDPTKKRLIINIV